MTPDPYMAIELLTDVDVIRDGGINSSLAEKDGATWTLGGHLNGTKFQGCC